MPTIYQNRDGQYTDILINIKDQRVVTDWRSIADQPLNSAIYFRPSSFPLVNVNDATLGTAWKHWSKPTGSFVIQQGDTIELLPVNKDVTMCEYASKVGDTVTANIHDIYRRHPQVNLCYSGGIDSMVLLSFIINLGYLSRTRLICFENHTQIDHRSLHNDPNSYHNLSQTLARVCADSLGVDWHFVDSQALSSAFNQGTLADLICYTTSYLLQQYQDSALMFGFHGNQVLLHKTIFVDEMRYQGLVKDQDITGWLQHNPDCYTQSLKDMDLGKHPVSIDNTHFVIKPWHQLDGRNGNRVYSPLADSDTFDLLRRMRWDTCDLATVADAGLARTLIQQNCPWLADLVSQEGLYDSDCLNPVLLDLPQIDPSMLEVPQDLCHDAQGSQWLEIELLQAKETGRIPLNILVSIKMLRKISQSLQENNK